MKKYTLFAAILSLVTVSGIVTYRSFAETNVLPSPNLVISQVKTGGAVADDEFVELHNNGAVAVDLNGYRLVYRSAAGSTDVGPFAVWTTTTIVQPGQYYLIASTNYGGGVTPDITYNPTTCSCSMGAAGGGLAIRNGVQNTGTIIDSIGWGTATNAFVETTPATAKPTGKLAWPKTLAEQAQAVRSALTTFAAPADSATLAKTFKSAKTDRIEDILETLASLGQARALKGGKFVAV